MLHARKLVMTFRVTFRQFYIVACVAQGFVNVLWMGIQVHSGEISSKISNILFLCDRLLDKVTGLEPIANAHATLVIQFR